PPLLDGLAVASSKKKPSNPSKSKSQKEIVQRGRHARARANPNPSSKPQAIHQIQITKKRSSNAAAHLDAQQKSLAECSRLPHDFLYARAERFRRLCRDHRLELRCILRCVATIRFLLPQILERLSLPDVS